MVSAGDIAAFTPWAAGIFSLLLFALLVLLLIGLLLFLSRWPGAKKPAPEKLRAYESGIIPTGSARLRYPVPFFMVAVFFLIFDVEGAFIFAWAPSASKLGWPGWIEITFFILMLMIGLLYVWRRGGLAWGPNRPKK